MSEDLNRQDCQLSQYDTMTTEALEEILRLDSEAPEGQESDTERLLYIMELLAQREQQLHTPGKTALEAWKAFQQDYLPIEEDDYEEEDSESKSGPKPVRLRLYRWIAVAAAIALLIAIPVAASAIGWQDLWIAVAKWTRDTFSFVGSETTPYTAPSPNDIAHYTSLQEALEAKGLRSDFLPTWIPERYSFDNISLQETPTQKIFRALYLSGEESLNINIKTYIDTAPEYIEVEEKLLETYVVSGREYHIFSNFDKLRAAWLADNCECYISGDLTIEEIKKMIDSIGKE